MNILFIGDVFGKLGRSVLQENLSDLKRQHKIDFTIINGENAAHGKGMTQSIYNQFVDWGADAITMGNHTWDKREIFDYIDDADKMIRPANYPEGTPGVGMRFFKSKQQEIAVINLQGRTFMPPLDDPFQIIDQLVKEARSRTRLIFVDFHAEATSEKQAMGWYLDGRVSTVVGTHTHVQTADERILPNGTAYITDVGMTGPYDSVIGMETSSILRRFKTSLPVRFEVVETGRSVLSGVVVSLDPATGIAKSIRRILINDDNLSLS